MNKLQNLSELSIHIKNESRKRQNLILENIFPLSLCAYPSVQAVVSVDSMPSLFLLSLV